MPLRLAKFAVGAALLTSLAYAQGSSEPASSAIVSDPASSAETAHAASIKPDTSTEAPSPSIEVIPSDPTDSTPPEGIKPDKSTTPDEAAIIADPASLLPDLPPCRARIQPWSAALSNISTEYGIKSRYESSGEE